MQVSHCCLISKLDKAWWGVLRGEIASPNHYRPLRGKTRGQGWHFITPQKELPSLAYFTTTIQVLSKRSYKEK
jgi:hypothetical protein